MKLAIHELLHGLVTAPFAYLIYINTGSSFYALTSIVASYLIDADHLFDYFLFYGAKISPKKFFKMDYFKISKKAYVPLHGWEWLALLVIINIGKEWGSVERILLMAYIPHMVLDTINVGSVKFYSLIYRASISFKHIIT